MEFILDRKEETPQQLLLGKQGMNVDMVCTRVLQSLHRKLNEKKLILVKQQQQKLKIHMWGRSWKSA